MRAHACNLHYFRVMRLAVYYPRIMYIRFYPPNYPARSTVSPISVLYFELGVVRVFCFGTCVQESYVQRACCIIVFVP